MVRLPLRRWVVALAVGGSLLVAVSAGYWVGSRRGTEGQKATTLTALDATEASESGLVLRMAMRTLRAAEQHPEAFSKEDVRWFRQLLANSADNYEKVGIPYLRRDEAEERRRDPSRTPADEEARGERARRVRADARQLRARFAARE
jgi:hypothetical protein